MNVRVVVVLGNRADVHLDRVDQARCLSPASHRTRCGHPLDGFATRDDLDRWSSWLDGPGVAHSGVIDTDDPMPYSVIVFRDPGNIQLELIHMDG